MTYKTDKLAEIKKCFNYPEVLPRVDFLNVDEVQWLIDEVGFLQAENEALTKTIQTLKRRGDGSTSRKVSRSDIEEIRARVNRHDFAELEPYRTESPDTSRDFEDGEGW